MPLNNRSDPMLRAERAFAVRTQQKADAPQATTDYRAAEQALRDRTARLREARLAREAAETDKPKE
jgi:hypothetical protein